VNPLNLSDFIDFFHALYGANYDPFPWQTTLLQRVLDQGWPDLLDLPTASGKTACIDIGVFALAAQATVSTESRTTARRLFFVVDRRIVVDEAFERAERIAVALGLSTRDGKKLKGFQDRNARIIQQIHEPNAPIFRRIADRLCALSGTPVPLATARLRGGILRRDTWASSPAQPAVVTGTVDQIGSRLLFRSYGGSSRMAPVHAAMVAYDSLIILDEAHCSRPFHQTADAVRDYLKPEKKWSLDGTGIAPPLHLMIMSATPPHEIGTDRRFPPTEEERTAALEHPLLVRRRTARKLARLESIGKARGETDPLVAHAVGLALKQSHAGCRRIAIMVNRVKTAQAIREALSASEVDHDVVLLTGRMRPIDRDDLIAKWAPLLKAGSEKVLTKPIIIVTTQCLEVGADFSFDSLITECASFDSLLQRFGRLARLGDPVETVAFILARDPDVKNPDEADDPIYGNALARTWRWLQQNATDQVIDCGIDAMRARQIQLSNEERDQLLAPHNDAPVLMPAHVDLLCQTQPKPEPDPDIAAYLHGNGRGGPEARVSFRIDLRGDKDSWGQTLALCPPVGAECLSVPLFQLRRWLVREDAMPGEDVEGAIAQPSDSPALHSPAGRLFAVRRKGKWVSSDNPKWIRPGDMVVVPMSPDDAVPTVLGTAFPGAWIDRADEAYFNGQRRCVLRIQKDALFRVANHPAISALLKWANEYSTLEDADSELRDHLDAVTEAEGLPEWLKRVADKMRLAIGSRKGPRLRNARHPCDPEGRIISITTSPFNGEDEETEDDNESETGAAAKLDDHLKDTAAVAKQFARDVAPSHARTLEAAALWHDVGKLDLRFQKWLRDGDEVTAIAGPPLAKSDRPLRGSAGFRHEMLSVQLLETVFEDVLAEAGIDRGLLLHTVAAHHGYARPFAPYRPDTQVHDLVGEVNGRAITLAADKRQNDSPAHSLGSGIPERFWELTRRFGWWGLAYLEAIVRLSDAYASAHPTTRDEDEPP